MGFRRWSDQTMGSGETGIMSILLCAVPFDEFRMNCSNQFMEYDLGPICIAQDKGLPFDMPESERMQMRTTHHEVCQKETCPLMRKWEVKA